MGGTSAGFGGQQKAAVTIVVPRPLEPPFPGGPGSSSWTRRQSPRARAFQQGRQSFFFDTSERWWRFTCGTIRILRVSCNHFRAGIADVARRHGHPVGGSSDLCAAGVHRRLDVNLPESVASRQAHDIVLRACGRTTRVTRVAPATERRTAVVSWSGTRMALANEFKVRPNAPDTWSGARRRRSRERGFGRAA